MAWYETFFDKHYLKEYATVIAPDGGKREHRLTCRMYFYPELTKMLNDAGLVPLRVFGDYDGDEYTWDSRRMITLAEKRRAA
ncbi:MAG: hypothetical protein O7E52_24675 [Candidatus Poribacteria bacterium]|nr:hypothetical protein [Candidatus Poribacteria bacterium]